MSNEVSIENNENSQREQPSFLDDQNSEITMCSLIDSEQLPIGNKGDIESKLINESETTSVCIGLKDEDTLVEQVNKLDLTVKKSEGQNALNNEPGTVIQNKFSESLSFLQSYNSDSDDTSSGSESQDEVKDALLVEDSDESDSESDGENEELDDSDDLFCDGPSAQKQKKKEEKSLHELMADFGIADAPKKIPDISLLTLSPNEEFIHMGNIACILSQYVTVEGLPAMPAYDLDTLLFVDEGRIVLGYIFDVMGPVAAPMYVVTLDSVEAIENLQLKKGTKIYCAPKSKYTKYVFVQELMKVRGSDASWVGDMEVPVELEEFSDDEEERNRKSLKNQSIKRKRGSLERHQKFEANMNKINQLNSRLHKLKDAKKYFETRPKEQRGREVGCSGSAETTPSLPTGYVQPTFAGSYEAGFQNCTSQFVPNWRTHSMDGYAKNYYPPNQPSGQNNFFEEYAFFPPPTHQSYYSSAFYPMNSTAMANPQNGTSFRPNDGSGPSSGC